VTICEEQTSDRVAPHLVVCELRPNLERIVGRGPQQPVMAESIESRGIDPSDDVEGVATAECEVSQTQERKVAGVRPTAIGLLVTADQPRPNLLHGVGIAEGRARETASDK